MESFFIIPAVAFIASMLTFFSGFGLGTILTPFFAIFFPINTAIMLTAIVHFLNNIFKLVLIGKNIEYKVLLRFGLPAIIGAFAGAQLLLYLPKMPPVFEYAIGGKIYEITPVNLIIAVLMTVFSLIEIIPRFSKISFAQNKLVPGGIISGFFGGLSGHQGALRSMFLIKLNLPKETFIATGVAIACLVDVSRLSVYFSHFSKMNITENYGLILAAVFSAFAGAYAGNRLLKKVTIKFLQIFVSTTIILLAIALAAGLIS